MAALADAPSAEAFDKLVADGPVRPPPPRPPSPPPPPRPPPPPPLPPVPPPAPGAPDAPRRRAPAWPVLVGQADLTWAAVRARVRV